MRKVFISLPDQLLIRMRSAFPPRQRSKIIAQLIEKEIEKRERKLYECAVTVEKDKMLNKETAKWDRR